MRVNRSAAMLAGLSCFVSAYAGRSWAAVGFGAGESLDSREFLVEAAAIKEPELSAIRLAGHVEVRDPNLGKPGKELQWVYITGGKFAMGTDSGLNNAKPIHEVKITSFEISKTLVTVEQYAECVIKDQCTAPATGDYCNWGKADRQRHPVNCVNWHQANQYAMFKDARLPSESEWEYAATSAGENQKYPWGNEDATCERAVMNGDGGYGCGSGGTMPVCSKPKGNTKQGLCDMAGNVAQWVQDKYQGSYAAVPTDGSAFEASGSYRVVRGGSFDRNEARHLRSDYRGYGDPDYSLGAIGFRIARAGRWTSWRPWSSVAD